MSKIFVNKQLIFTWFLLLIVLGGCGTKENANPYNFPDYVGKIPGTFEAYKYAVEAEYGHKILPPLPSLLPMK